MFQPKAVETRKLGAEIVSLRRAEKMAACLKMASRPYRRLVQHCCCPGSGIGKPTRWSENCGVLRIAEKDVAVTVLSIEKIFFS